MAYSNKQGYGGDWAADEDKIQPLDLETILDVKGKVGLKYWYLNRPKLMVIFDKKASKIQAMAKGRHVRQRVAKDGWDSIVPPHIIEGRAKAKADREEAERRKKEAERAAAALAAQAAAEERLKKEQEERLRREEEERVRKEAEAEALKKKEEEERLQREEEERLQKEEEERLKREMEAEAALEAAERAEEARLAEEEAMRAEEERQRMVDKEVKVAIKDAMAKAAGASALAAAAAAAAAAGEASAADNSQTEQNDERRTEEEPEDEEVNPEQAMSFPPAQSAAEPRQRVEELKIVSARIIGSSVVSDELGKKYVLYKLEILTDTPGKYRRLHTYKRYSTFHKLCEQLVKEKGYSKSQIPKLPSKALIGNLSPQLIEERTHKLNEFLDAAVKADHLQWGIQINDSIAAYKRRMKRAGSRMTTASQATDYGQPAPQGYFQQR